MSYTTPAEMQRRQALIQGLRQDPRGGYARNPLGAIAQGLNAYSAGSQGDKLEEMQSANVDLRKNDMNKLTEYLRGSNERDDLRAQGVSVLAPEDQQANPQFEHPDVSNAYTSSIMAQELAKQKALTTAGSNPSYAPVYTAGGIGAFDRRSGGVDLVTNPATGKPFIRSKDDPALQSTLAGASAQGAGDVATSLIGDQAQPKADSAALIASAVADSNLAATEAQGAADTKVEVDKVAAVGEAERQEDLRNNRTKLETKIGGQGAKLASVHEDIDTAISQASVWTTGFIGKTASFIPGTPQHNLSLTLDTIKANIGFDRLQEMRDSSQSGGALGQVSDHENKLLQAVWGALGQSQSKDQFIANLKRVKKATQDSWDRVNAAYEKDYGITLGEADEIRILEAEAEAASQ